MSSRESGSYLDYDYDYDYDYEHEHEETARGADL